MESEESWRQSSGLTNRNHIRLQLGIRLHIKSKSNNYPELTVVNVADTWSERLRSYLGRSRQRMELLKRLDRIYTASSLRDSVKLVQTDVAKAYRNKLNEWMIAISELNYDNMQMIEDDIVKAQKAMKYKGIIEKAGKVCATSGVVATTLGVISLPAEIIATAATFLGFPTAFLDPTRKYLWASFGVYDR